MRAVTVAIHVVPSVAHFTVPSRWDLKPKYIKDLNHLQNTPSLDQCILHHGEMNLE